LLVVSLGKELNEMPPPLSRWIGKRDASTAEWLDR